MVRSKQDIMEQRRLLLAKISDQRIQLAETAARWQPALVYADRALVLVKFVRVHSIALFGLTGLFVMRRNGFTVLAKGVWRAWRLYGYLNDLSKKLKFR